MSANLRTKVMRWLMATLIAALLIGSSGLPEASASECPTASGSTCT